MHRLYAESYNYYMQAEKSTTSKIAALRARLYGANMLLFKGELKQAEAIIQSCHSEENPARSKAIRILALQLLAILRNNQKRYTESLRLYQQCIGMLGKKDMVNVKKSMA